MNRALPRLRTVAAMMLMASGLSANAVPVMEQGIQIGDVTDGRAIIWSRSDCPSRMMVEYALDKDFTNSIVLRNRAYRISVNRP